MCLLKRNMPPSVIIRVHFPADDLIQTCLCVSTMIACVVVSLPDCVVDLLHTEATGGLRWLLSSGRPFIPLPLRHELEGFFGFAPVLRLHRLHRIEFVHVCGPVCCSQREQVPFQITISISTADSCSRSSKFVLS